MLHLLIEMYLLCVSTVCVMFSFCRPSPQDQSRLCLLNSFIFTNSILTVLFVRWFFQSVCFHVWFLWTATFGRSCLGMCLLSKWTKELCVIVRRSDSLFCIKKTLTRYICWVYIFFVLVSNCSVRCTWRKILAVRNYERHLQSACLTN